ncbi:hypothetical protein KCP71_19710 [Salmonella enterica subsp. enterica]|nr:hypothetical protein KCP71_19710 [Salmonella enterica subsp. enterica]
MSLSLWGFIAVIPSAGESGRLLSGVMTDFIWRIALAAIGCFCGAGVRADVLRKILPASQHFPSHVATA